MQGNFSFWAILLACVCVLHSGMATAQRGPRSQLVGYSDIESRGMAPGLTSGLARFQTRDGIRQSRFLRVDMGQPFLSVEVSLDEANPHDTATLETRVLARSARSGIVLQPPATGFGNGLVYTRRSLFSWPANGAPHLLLLPEGAARPAIPDDRPALVAFDDGTSLTLASVNGALPASPGEAAVYTGRLATRELPMVRWPAGLVGLLLRPVDLTQEVHRLLGNGPGDDFPFRAEDLLARDRLRVGPGELLLVVHEQNAPALALLARDRARAAVRIPLPPEVRLAAAVVPTGPILRSAGRDLVPGETPVYTALALDATGRHFMAIGAPDDSFRAGVSLAALGTLLASLDFTELVALPGNAPAVLADLQGRAADTGQGASAIAHAALVIAERPASFRLAGGEDGLQRIRGIAVQGTLREFPANFPRALQDRNAAPDPAANTFWASPATRPDGDPESLLFLLPRPMRIGAIDILHAENAGFSPPFNLRAYRIAGRNRRDAPWQTLRTIRHEEPIARERLAFPDLPTLSEVRLDILEPNFLPNGDVARIAEVYFWSPEAYEQ